MQSSPEKDGLTDLELDSKEKAQNTEKVSALNHPDFSSAVFGILIQSTEKISVLGP